MNVIPENKSFHKILISRSVSEEQEIAVYVLLVVLSKMKQRLGLEAVLEYIEKSKYNFRKNNPALIKTVNYALTRVNVEKIYKDASYGQDEYNS